MPVGLSWLNGAHDAVGQLCGIAVVERPVARELDDGLTADVTRICTTGEPNTDSMRYAAAERAAKAKGHRRWLTHLLASEWDRFDVATGRRTGGAGARSAGWQELRRVDGRNWDCKSRARVDKHPTEDKVVVREGA